MFKKLDFQEFIRYVEEKDKLPLDSYNRKINMNKLDSYYDIYIKRFDKLTKENKFFCNKDSTFKVKQNSMDIDKYDNMDFKTDTLWEQTRSTVIIRDKNECQLYKLLSNDEKQKIDIIFSQSSNFSKLDPAHIFGKGAYPELRYAVDNVVLIYRLFHSRLDTYKNPLTGEDISKQERLVWFEKIIGEEKLQRLIEKLNN